MKRLIKNIAILVIVLCITYVQPVFASDYNLNDYIYNHLENWDTEFEIPYYNDDVLEVVQDVAKKDDYLSRSMSKLYYKLNGGKATLEVTYRTTKEQEEYIDKELKSIVNSIIASEMSDFDKVKTINQYLINRYEYDDTLVSNNVYSALTTGKTTCQGYAMSAYKMLNLAGLENRIVVGTLDGTPHGWNLVKVNGKWYHLDITNDDAVDINKYFLKSDYYLRQEGFSWNSSDYPTCDENYEETAESHYERETYGDANNKSIISNNSNEGTSNKQQYSSNAGQGINGYRSNVDGNWCFLNGSWYFLKSEGNYAIGWNIINNNWYYLGNDGAMQTGWIYYNGKWYYCYLTTGAMAVNTNIDKYIVDKNGAWIA